MKYLFLSILFFLISGLLHSQKNDYTAQPENGNYYLQQWNSDIDSLSTSWIIKKHNSAAQIKAQGETGLAVRLNTELYNQYFDQLSSDFPFTNHPRVEEILNSILSRKNDLEIALSYSDFLSSVFEEALKRNKLPTQLKHLPLALSALNKKSVNKTGASGVWLMMYANARRQGLSIDSYVDERRDIHLATQGAVMELKTYFELYKNWELALAAYACGPTNVNKAIRRNNNNFDFYTIYSSLPDYGRDIVPALTAFCMVDQFSNELELNKPNWDFSEVVDTIEVSRRLHFVQIQDIMNIPIDEIRYLNPKYKFDIVPAIDEVYHLYLPVGNIALFNELEDSIYNYKDTILFNLKKPVVLPPAAKGRHYARYEPELPPDNSTLVYYTIKSGDNLGYISSWYGVTVRQIEDWNNIYDPRRLKLDKKLKIYVPEKKASYYAVVDDLSFDQKQKRIGKSVSSTKEKAEPKKEKPLGKDFFWYTVRSGESPYTIAKKYPGVSSDDILRWNNITNPRNIKVGQKLKIKKIK